MTEPSVIRAQEADLPALAMLEARTFRETFSDVYNAQDLEEFLSTKKNLPAITAEWSSPGTQYFILRHEGQEAGFIKLNLHRQPDNGTLLPEPVMELEKIYVLGAYFGKGLGKILMEHAIAVARENFVRTIWLGVWEHNLRALAFYKKEGFSQFGEHQFSVGRQTDRDLLLAKVL
ncbi:GNAT family N-acetyltransferase [Chitinophaga sp. GCM10012297]|uniref:GNAT family N-acetyltransferase n=1 Tax=Chitinophaga chungangae TaxID=2821488 RepID=A0ABS3YIA8_9BACT|nr:GNAT family N-acetyltransferase [Chitinophaga chungangae]MBO9154427.1 GNAT family N-acetyltransferase [Chitinophaga chungangae]